MCIVIYAPKGKLIPKDHLINSFNNNSDGAGFMYQTNGKVHIKKGFMTFKAFWEAFKRVPANVDRVVHFRIATSGKVVPGNCHPYPLEASFESMNLLDYETNIGVAHNGIISWCSPSDRLKNMYSDTSIFIINHLAPLRTVLMKSDILDVLIDKATSSKFAIMAGFGTKIIGDFIEEEGVFYSNSSFRYDHYRYAYYNGSYGRQSSVRNYPIVSTGYGNYGAGYLDEYGDDGFFMGSEETIKPTKTLTYEELEDILSDASILISIDIKGKRYEDSVVMDLIEELGEQGCQPYDYTVKNGKLYVAVVDTPYTEKVNDHEFSVVRYDSFLTGKRASVSDLQEKLQSLKTGKEEDGEKPVL